MFYAATPGAFVDLAADAARQHPAPGAVVLDTHLDEPNGAHPVAGSTGFSEMSVTNQAIGVMMGTGRTAGQARAALQAQAVGSDLDLADTARAVMATATTRHRHRQHP